MDIEVAVEIECVTTEVAIVSWDKGARVFHRGSELYRAIVGEIASSIRAAPMMISWDIDGSERLDGHRRGM